jgi:hypothetical protein
VARVGLFGLVALVVAWVGWWRCRRRLQAPLDDAMRVLPVVVDRAVSMARERGPVLIAPPGQDDDIASAVRILRPAKVEPLPADAPVARPRRKARPRSMTPKAVAARRARARQRASEALGIPLAEPAVPWPDPVSLPGER